MGCPLHCLVLPHSISNQKTFLDTRYTLVHMSVQIWGYADNTPVLEVNDRFNKGRYGELEIVVEHVGLTIDEKKNKLMIRISWGRQNETVNFWELNIWSAISIYICGQLCDINSNKTKEVWCKGNVRNRAYFFQVTQLN
jgi:hypothetical protein